MTATRYKRYRFSLQLAPAQLRHYYQGRAGTIQVLAECGQRLRFPAGRLRPFMTHTGVRGRFQLTVDAENRVIELKKIN